LSSRKPDRKVGGGLHVIKYCLTKLTRYPEFKTSKDPVDY